MSATPSKVRIPATRAALIKRYLRGLESIGTPVDQLLSGAGIFEEILESDEALVPLRRAFKFGELACHAVGSDHLPLVIGLPATLGGYGSYGKLVSESRTVYEYLEKGAKLYNLLITGQRLWLSRHRDHFRLNLDTVGDPGLGSYQTHLQSILTTIAVLKCSLGSGWAPGAISLAYRSRENLPDSELLDGSPIFRGSGLTFITISNFEMTRVFQGDGTEKAGEPGAAASRSIPLDFPDLVEFQIESLLSGGKLHIDLVAESMMMSRRSLQRRLAESRQSYSHLLSETRLKLAAERLAGSDQTVTDIAVELGYRNASNFTRAFRQRTGVSPLHFRTTSAEEPQSPQLRRTIAYSRD